MANAPVDPQEAVTSPPPAPPARLERPSLSADLAASLARWLQTDAVARWALIAGTVWLWLTLLTLTLETTRDITGLSALRNAASFAGAGSPLGTSGAFFPGAPVGSLLWYLSVASAALNYVALAPLAVTWGSLLGVTRMLAFLAKQLAFPAASPREAMGVAALQRLAEDAVLKFISWFRWFILTWIAFLLVSATNYLLLLLSLGHGQ